MNKLIVYLQGGLGNQMFQYAFFLLLKSYNNKAVYNTSLYYVEKGHNGYELERVFGIPQKKSLSKLLLVKISSFFFHRNVKIKFFHPGFMSYYNDKSLAYSTVFHPGCYVGYWQDSKLVERIKTEIFTSFKFQTNKINPHCKSMLECIRQSDCAVSLHIRRGDFLSESNIKIYGNICTPSYYKTAVAKILALKPNAKFFIFTNDPTWVKENFHIPNSTMVDCNEGNNSYLDMYLMTQCKHNIIANSSFSWWGAYLNDNPEKIVIAPAKFTNIDNPVNIFPNEWMQIEG